MSLRPTATEAVERTVQITLTIDFKTLNCEIPPELAVAYFRAALAEHNDDAELFGSITEVNVQEALVPQDEIDNAAYLVCLCCGGAPPCDCTPEEIAGNVKATAWARKHALLRGF